MIHILSKEKINKHFSDEKIQAYMQELVLTKLESILYLWFYNNAHVVLDDFKKDNGRQMFVKFAKSITDLINECKKDKTILDDIEEIINNFAKEDVITLPDLSVEKNYKLIAEQYAEPIKQIIGKIKEVKNENK